MPVMYSEADSSGDKLLNGHFASYDVDGNAYVWSEGGTSYTRSIKFKQIVKCKYCFPMTTMDEGVLRTKLINDGGVDVVELPDDYVEPITLKITTRFYKTRSGNRVEIKEEISKKKFKSFIGVVTIPADDPYDKKLGKYGKMEFGMFNVYCWLLVDWL